MSRINVSRPAVAAFLRDQEHHRTMSEIVLATGCSRTQARVVMHELAAAGRLHTDQGAYPYAYLLLPPPVPPDITRFYLTDPADRNSPKSLNAYTTPARETIWPGDRVAYQNPAMRQADGNYETGGIDGPLTVTALVDFGEGYPPQAILNDGLYEVSAVNLRRLPRGEIAVQDARTSGQPEHEQENA